MVLNKNQLYKTLQNAPQGHILVLSVTPIIKNSPYTEINELKRFLAKNGEFTIIAIKK